MTRKVVLYALAIGFALYLVVPFYWIVNMSFMHEVDAASVPPHFLPNNPTLANYLGFVNPSTKQALVGSNAVGDTPYALVNSMVVALSTALVNLVLGTFAAYSFSRIRFRGSQVLLIVYLLTRMVPGIAIIIPFYLVMRTLDLLDTYGALILSYTTFALPITIWILKDYFRTVPRELEDAARVDRCGWFSMMWKVFLPISAPGLVAAAIFSFMTAWNEFMFALFMTSSISSKTIPVIAANFATDVETQVTLMAAAGVLAVVPPLVLVLICQRLIVQGMAAGSVKG
ncbi:carbohydrate ABC transporter permease [Pseudonocardia sp. DSM 110487]|uniref:carbohydrate ABC transporter permease n=1 Tax=Pseudonocardia sp. DSM 110487 TaxID=2865833 RepID=UPI001C69D2A6|nr:carbohydrate ABC transporter permease [Pseudonocardia sp. DSM 110487]QYN37498.1 carbohydrate ABC transporter permease [Pseudonocardia sp. DSM 110487]